MIQLFLFIWTTVFITQPTNAVNSESRLQNDKLREYNKNVIPKLNKTTPVLVKVLFYPVSIIRFNEREELLYINAFLNVDWTDHNLAWIPAQYENVTVTLYKQGQIWLPDLVLIQSKDEMEQIGFDHLNVLVDSFGNVHWEPGISAEIICAVDTTYFPFDEQICTIQLATWLHAPSMVEFTEKDINIDVSNFVENGQWELRSFWTVVYRRKTYSSLRFRIKLLRRTDYYVTSLLLPVITVSTLNCLVFLIPRDSGEKTSYGMTIFLSYMVLLTLTTESLPKTSKHGTIFVKYLACMLALSFFSIVSSVITNMMQRKDKDNVEMDANFKDESSDESLISEKKGTAETNKICSHSGKGNFSRMVSEKNKLCIEETSVKASPLTFPPSNAKGYETIKQRNICYVMARLGKYFKGTKSDFVMFVIATSTTVVITCVTFHTLVISSKLEQK